MLLSIQTLIYPDFSLTPLQALASFMIEQTSLLFCHIHYDNSVIKQLYRLSYHCQNQIYARSYKLVEAVDIACPTQTNTLERAKKSLKDVLGTSKTVKVICRETGIQCTAQTHVFNSGGYGFIRRIFRHLKEASAGECYPFDLLSQYV